MPGIKNMLLGLLWAFGGALVTWLTYSAASGGGTYIVAYGAIFAGAIQFVIGLFQFLAALPLIIGFQLKKGKIKKIAHAEASLRVILRAMMAAAAADGKIEDSEVDTIATIYNKMFDSTLEKKWIKENIAQMMKDNFDIYDAIRKEKALIEPSIIPIVFKASYFVASADGSIDENESKILLKIATALGMSEPDIKSNLAELQNPVTA